MALSYLENLSFITTRLTGESIDGEIWHGTGFFYNFYDEMYGTKYPRHITIVTNAHNIEHLETLTFKLPVLKGDKKITDWSDEDDLELEDFEYVELTISEPSLSELVVYHPNDDIDLCVIKIRGVINASLNVKKFPFFKAWDHRDILVKKRKKVFDVVEEILMIGYPNGLADEANNLPIFRKGVTATHPEMDYNGKKEFLIDIASYKGSSGSPIVLYEEIVKKRKFPHNHYQDASKPCLLGIIYQGELIEIEETSDELLEKQESSMRSLQVAMHLGNVIRAELLKDFDLALFDKKDANQ
jgi:hypothetical protein